MRTSLCVLAALGSVATFACGSAIGCGSLPDSCEARLACPPGASTSSGGGGGTPAACIPSENGGPVVNDCGVFVSSSKGKDGTPGTKENPVQTLDAAITLAKTGAMRVYACAETFTGTVTIDDRIELYGGLDCTKDW